MSLLQENQKEQLQEISKTLRQVRQEKSIQLEEVALKTNIRLACLKALDNENFDELPEPVYIQGFIRRYADVIGLDGVALSQTFSLEVKTPQFDSKFSQNLEKNQKFSLPLFIPYAILLLVAAAGLMYVLNPQFSAESFVKKFNLGTPKKQTTAELSTPASLPTASSSPSSNQEPISISAQNSLTSLPVVASPNTSQNQSVAVTLELKGKSWLQVTIDGKTEFVGDLKKGARKTWTAKKQLTVRSGNAGVVLVSVNNKPATPLGTLGKIKEVTFTPEGNTQGSIVNSQ
ncbi:helix-turn-helix domain-containing protein [Nostoc sp. LEGE 06077]|uniref:helix-turn-helix domain-containing protein n=1 Tax=Nostoc sp. LEGE 06077 TaxID=915325 RepID=UPI001880FB3B|nr:RodZ family helix-turn-helix domain-containing protein [Nostoc sp. LEGE 06077]MBE9207885.1 helix-turn-helix domain-containing protein [Nostoc sp. LEGE 06077]